MRTISKGSEPTSLTAWRATNPTDFNGYQDMDTLRESLVAEQRGICCYCQCRIYSAYNWMKVEHWHSYERYPQERLLYRNLLGACLGGHGKPGREQHCDTYKANKDLCRNPADPTHKVDALIRYLSDGRVISESAELNEQINSVLNLNLDFLKENRKQQLNSFIKLLQLKPGHLNRSFWLRLFDTETGASHNGELRPFCGVITYWIQKKLKRAAQ